MPFFFIKTRKVIVDKDNDDEYEPSVLGDFQKSIDRYLSQK